MLNVWLLSPYHTGSHLAWATGYAAHTRHRLSLLTMTGRFWKWRMQGGAIEMAAQARRLLAEEQRPDVVLATDMVNLPAWITLLRHDLPVQPPIALYMHENQLTYPWRSGEGRDLTYAMINWLSQLSADLVIFNSHYHRNAWFKAIPDLLKHFPDYRHLELLAPAKERSLVAPVGIDVARFQPPNRTNDIQVEPPLILWNQRWEYDKRPDRFFALLYRLHRAGVPFRLAVAGENFRNTPEEFETAREALADMIEQWGYLADPAAYVDLLQQADLVVSTADHEFFGISIVEAIAAGAFPLLPRRLSYPELIPADLHPACLYDDEDELFEKARQRLTLPRGSPPSLRTAVRHHYAWPVVAGRYDELLDNLVERFR